LSGDDRTRWLSRGGRHAASWALSTALILALGLALGVGLGALSWSFWVIGLFGIVSGLVLGFTASALLLWLGLAPRWPALVLVGLAALVARGALEIAEDRHQRRAFGNELAALRAAETGLPPDESQRILEVGGADYLVEDADAELERQVVARFGEGGPWGRWQLRAQAGVRLAGSWRGGRSLPVGPIGVGTWTVAELALAITLARRIVTRLNEPPIRA
jgi:hypothetical protein